MTQSKGRIITYPPRWGAPTADLYLIGWEGDDFVDQLNHWISKGWVEVDVFIEYPPSWVAHEEYLSVPIGLGLKGDVRLDEGFPIRWLNGGYINELKGAIKTIDERINAKKDARRNKLETDALKRGALNKLSPDEKRALGLLDEN